MRGIRYYKLRVRPRLYSTPGLLNVDTVLEESERNYLQKKDNTRNTLGLHWPKGRETSVFRKLDSFHESIGGDSGSRFSRSSESSFSIPVVESLVWPRGYHVDGLRMQFFGNCSQTSMGLLRFGTNYFIRLEKRLAILFQIAENLLRRNPAFKLRSRKSSLWFSRLSRSVTAVLFSSTRMMRRKEETNRYRKRFQVVRFIALWLTLFSHAQQAVHLRRTRHDPTAR